MTRRLPSALLGLIFLFFPILAEAAPHVDLETFLDAVLWSWGEAEKVREKEGREISASSRFASIFDRLGLDQHALPERLLDRILETHRLNFSRAAVFPDEYRDVLRRLRRRYRIALVSNFDYSPTVELILERESIADCFETIVVSDAIGWRKPHPAIFNEAMRRLSLTASDVLFVGDRPELDVLGAKRVGMAAAWVNPSGEAFPDGIPSPDYEIRGLGDLENLLRR